MKVLIKPLVTEKITAQTEKFGRYGFEVNRDANKIQIKKAVEQFYNVTVSAVNTVSYGSRKKSRYTKAGVITGRTNAYKKAFVTLGKGENIDFYSNI